MPKKTSILMVTLIMAALAGCGTGYKSSRPQVVATTGQVAELVNNVAGTNLTVKQLVPNNSDSHEFEPGAADASKVESAEIVFLSGAGLDHWAKEIASNAGEVKTFDLFRQLPTKLGSKEEGRYDPHWWHDPSNAVAAVSQISNQLSRKFPDEAAVFRANSATYVKQLQAIDRQIKTCVEEIPSAKRKLVTNHDALGYFANRYGLKTVAVLIPSLSTEAQPSSGEIDRVVQIVKREKIATVLAESTVNPKLARVVARESGARFGQKLYADSLGPKGSAGSTYTGSLRHNAQAVVSGLSARDVECF